MGICECDSSRPTKEFLYPICLFQEGSRVRYGGTGYGMGGRGGRSISKPRNLRGFRDASGQLVFDPDDENLSDKELYARNIPAIGRLYVYIRHALVLNNYMVSNIEICFYFWKSSLACATKLIDMLTCCDNFCII